MQSTHLPEEIPTLIALKDLATSVLELGVPNSGNVSPPVVKEPCMPRMLMASIQSFRKMEGSGGSDSQEDASGFFLYLLDKAMNEVKSFEDPELDLEAIFGCGIVRRMLDPLHA